MILVENKQDMVTLDIKCVERDAQKVLEALDYADFDLSVVFVTDEQMQRYNSTFRGKNKPTDILSFAHHPHLQAGERVQPQGDDDRALGDIIMAPAYINNDLARWNMGFEERLRVLLVHGICHLLGYDHESDTEHAQMQALEDRLLEQL